jgi:hypothetical protein
MHPLSYFDPLSLWHSSSARCNWVPHCQWNLSNSCHQSISPEDLQSLSNRANVHDQPCNVKVMLQGANHQLGRSQSCFLFVCETVKWIESSIFLLIQSVVQSPAQTSYFCWIFKLRSNMKAFRVFEFGPGQWLDRLRLTVKKVPASSQAQCKHNRSPKCNRHLCMS